MHGLFNLISFKHSKVFSKIILQFAFENSESFKSLGGEGGSYEIMGHPVYILEFRLELICLEFVKFSKSRIILLSYE